MRSVKDIIANKRNGDELAAEDIAFFVNAMCDGNVSSAQVGAWLMAIYLQGMTDNEIVSLTKAMAYSGSILELPDLLAADKHSTGGVGDKTSLVLVPLLASCGIKMAKLSGRALGHTGGTLDKLSCFSGIRLDLDRKEMVGLLDNVGCFISGQTDDMVPADKLMYALRDETGTVSSLPLIASSIMSKKIAGGAQHILLDVKVGRGAIFDDPSEARALAECMVRIGNQLGRPTRAVLTAMHQPLGMAVGNLMEVQEAIETLQGNGPEDLRSLCFALGHHVLHLTGQTRDRRESQTLLESKLGSGAALDRLRHMIKAQGGSWLDDHQFRQQENTASMDLAASRTGYVHGIDAKAIGIEAMRLSRVSNGENIDLTAGIILHKKVGESVDQGTSLLTLYGRDYNMLNTSINRLDKAYDILPDPPEASPLIIDVIG